MPAWRGPSSRRTCGWPGSPWRPGSPRSPACTSAPLHCCWWPASAAGLRRSAPCTCSAASAVPGRRAALRLDRRRGRPRRGLRRCGHRRPARRPRRAADPRPGRAARPGHRRPGASGTTRARCRSRRAARRCCWSPTELVRLTGPDGRPDPRVRCGCWCSPPTRPGAACCPGSASPPRAGSAPPRGGDLTAAVLSTTARPCGTARRPGRSGPPGRCAPGCNGPARRCPTSPAGCCPAWWSATPAGCDPPSSEDFRATGMTHLTAVCGANVAIVVGAGAAAGPLVRGPARGSPPALCAVALVGFVVLVRPVAERGAGRRDGRDRAARAGRRPAPGRAAGAGRRRHRAGAGRPGAGRRRRVRAVRAGHRRPAAARARAGGTRCGAGACRPGWPRRWPCRPPRRWPARR